MLNNDRIFFENQNKKKNQVKMLKFFNLFSFYW